MRFEWDPDKALSNLEKHGVDFADAALVLYDPLAVTILDDDHGENRFVTVGVDPMGIVLVVVYILREENIRIISARPATRAERRRYESGE